MHSPHVIKVANVHIATNNEKLLIVLYSSKTHSEADRPQKIKIVANQSERTGHYAKRHFCPFKLLRKYISLRHKFCKRNSEQFFIFSDGTPVSAENARTLLRKLLIRISIQAGLYDMHSFRIGRSSDLRKFGYSVDDIKKLGRWMSNVIYKYFRNY